ncbi:MAG: DUF1275 domain-containing protein [Hyphomicrobiales bacterium]|nr:DUF1275 domain-containing protein [Hyphomicrobiales bacterium]
MTEAGPSPASPEAGLKLMTAVLSLIAGSMDAIGFLGLGGLFTAHITGNLVILAAHVAAGGTAQAAPMLSVPVFMAALLLARLLAGILEKMGRNSLRPLLLLQLLSLAGCLAVCGTLGSGFDANGATATLAGMTAVCALGIQNALVQVSLHGVPATAVVTTNLARFTTDIGTILLGEGPDTVAQARRRADRLWPSIAGFVVGCSIGAVCEARYGLVAVAAPAGLALIALAMAWASPFRQSTDPRDR